MKHLLTLLLLCLLGTSTKLYSQLEPGSLAPDFTLTDIDGNTHNLYSYLDQGKMVVVEFSATWCGPCWNYMLSGALETFWEEHGPDGDNTAMVLYIEADQTTDMDDLLGLTNESQGNWVEAIPFPIIDLQAGENTDNDYGVGYYPTLYAVCSDYTVWELGQVSAQTWSDFITSCQLAGDVNAVTDADCYGDGHIDIDYSGGNAPLSYDWSNGDNTPDLSNVGAGTYSVTITDDLDKFIIIEDLVIDGAEEPISLTDSAIEEPLCNGNSNGSVDVDIEGGTPGYEYSWSNGDNTQNISGLEAGTYTLTVTDDNGCEFEQSFAVDEPDVLEVDGEVSTENCDMQNGTVTLAISGGVGGYDISSSDGEIVGNQVTELSDGTVTVYVEDANGCEWESDYEIEDFPAPEAEIQQGDDLTCLDNTTSLTAIAWSGTGDYEYSWSTNGGHIVSGQNTQTINIDEEGTYFLLVTDFVTGCEFETDIAVVAEVILPDVEAGADFPINCENNEPVIQGSGDPLNSITWTTQNGNIVSGGNTYTPVVDEPGTYLISVVHSGTGCSNVDTVVVLNNLDPAQAAYSYQSSSLTIITSDQSTGSNLNGWSWTFGDGNSSNENSPVHTYAAEGTYEVCLSVQNGCGVSTTCSPVSVTFEGSLLSVLEEITHVACNGDSSGAISLVVNGGSGIYSYSWTGPGGSSFNTSDISGLVSGQYVVIISDDQGNSIVGDYDVLQPDAIQVGSSIVTDNLCNGQTNGSISVEMNGGVAPYLYSWNGGPPQSEGFINQLGGGVYEVVVTDANNCTLLVGPYTINEPPAIAAESILITDALCHGDLNGSAALTINGGVAPYTYQWVGTGIIEPILTGVGAGTYTLVVTDANACVKELSVGIAEPAVLAVTSTEVHDASNEESNNGSISLQIAGGTAPYSVTWNTGATGEVITGLIPGEYTYYIIDAHGCLLASDIPVKVNNSTGTSEAEASLFISVTPNPSNGKVSVKWQDLIPSESSLSLLTLDGRVIGSHDIQSQDGIWDLTNLELADGIYIVVLQKENRLLPTKLVVIK